MTLEVTIIQLIKKGKTRCFWKEDGLILTKGKHILIPSDDYLQREVMKECHDSKCVVHPGLHMPHAFMGDSYHWPQFKDDVEAYVKTYLVC